MTTELWWKGRHAMAGKLHWGAAALPLAHLPRYHVPVTHSPSHLHTCTERHNTSAEASHSSGVLRAQGQPTLLQRSSA